MGAGVGSDDTGTFVAACFGSPPADGPAFPLSAEVVGAEPDPPLEGPLPDAPSATCGEGDPPNGPLEGRCPFGPGPCGPVVGPCPVGPLATCGEGDVGLNGCKPPEGEAPCAVDRGLSNSARMAATSGLGRADRRPLGLVAFGLSEPAAGAPLPAAATAAGTFRAASPGVTERPSQRTVPSPGRTIWGRPSWLVSTTSGPGAVSGAIHTAVPSDARPTSWPSPVNSTATVRW